MNNPDQDLTGHRADHPAPLCRVEAEDNHPHTQRQKQQVAPARVSREQKPPATRGAQGT